MRSKVAPLVRTMILLGLFAAVGLAQQKPANKPKNSDVENIGNRNINKHSINFMSLEREIALGRSMAAELDRTVKLVDDPDITEYVNRVGQNIVRNSDAQVPFTIKVIESDEINALALPGGFMYVNTALILAADEEDELAGVMAHEIAHVAARHGAENASKGQLMDFATIPLIILGGPIGSLGRQATELLIPAAYFKFSRGSETEADYLGLQYAYKTGYDPTAALTFFEKLQAREKASPGAISKLFSTHPPTGDRIEKSKSNIQKVLPDREQYVVTTSEFDRVKVHLQDIENRVAVKAHTENQKQDDDKPVLRRRP